jgi:hypothetical protein
MSYRDGKTTPSVMGALTRYIAERLFNLEKLMKKGGAQVCHSSAAVLGDCVVTEAKLDALILLLEKEGIDMSKFNDFLEESCRIGQANAISIRKQFEAMVPK